MEKIPVNIISGFLGSGKTTAIIRLLGQKQPDECWAIVVNEFGKVSIDGQTLQSKSAVGSVFDISGGCICCSARGYFKENLEKIIESGNFNRIIIEPSGLGGIEMVSEIVKTLPDLLLMPAICIVDITGFENPKFQKNLIYQDQIRKADHLVFSKCDLLENSMEQERLINKFTNLFPEKPYHLRLSINDLDLIVPNCEKQYYTQDKNKSQFSFAETQGLAAHCYLENFVEFGPEVIFCLEKLQLFLRNHQSIIRTKGYIRTKSGWNLFNYTLTGYSADACEERKANNLVIIYPNQGVATMEEIKKQIVKCFA